MSARTTARAAAIEAVDAGGGGHAARLVAVAAALVGVALSAYLTAEHYSHGTTFACPESSAINCLKVTTSRWSVIAGIPVAVLGLAYFVVMTGLLFSRTGNRWIALLRIAAAGVGVAMALYLVSIELFEVNAVCLWCTGVHLVTLVLFGAVLWSDSSRAISGRPAR